MRSCHHLQQYTLAYPSYGTLSGTQPWKVNDFNGNLLPQGEKAGPPAVYVKKTLWEVADVIEQIYTIAFTTNLQPDPEDREAAILDYRARSIKFTAQSGPSGLLVAAALTRHSLQLVCARRQIAGVDPMTFEQFAVAVHDWMRRLSPRQFRAEVARQLASGEGVEGLSRGISVEAALVMVRMGLGPGMRPVAACGFAPRRENVDVEPLALPDTRTLMKSDRPEPEPPSPRRPKKAASGAGQDLRGRPSKRAQALVRAQLAHGPKRGEDVQAAAHLVDISERSLIAAASALGVRTRKGQWWLPTAPARYCLHSDSGR